MAETPAKTVPLRQARKFQYRLITLLVIMLIAAILCAYLAMLVSGYRDQQRIAQRVEELGGFVTWKRMQINTVDLDGRTLEAGDVALLAQVNSVEMLNLAGSNIRDQDLAQLAALPHLYWLDLRDTQITDSGIAPLAASPRLEMIRLGGTQVTPAGVASLEGVQNQQGDVERAPE